MDDSESPHAGQPFLMFFTANQVALEVVFMVFKASSKSH
jgi:hypothetical protein